MKKLGKFLAIMMCAMLVFSAVACGKDKASDRKIYATVKTASERISSIDGDVTTTEETKMKYVIDDIESTYTVKYSTVHYLTVNYETNEFLQTYTIESTSTRVYKPVGDEPARETENSAQMMQQIVFQKKVDDKYYMAQKMIVDDEEQVNVINIVSDRYAEYQAVTAYEVDERYITPFFIANDVKELKDAYANNFDALLEKTMQSEMTEDEKEGLISKGSYKFSSTDDGNGLYGLTVKFDVTNSQQYTDEDGENDMSSNVKFERGVKVKSNDRFEFYLSAKSVVNASVTNGAVTHERGSNVTSTQKQTFKYSFDKKEFNKYAVITEEDETNAYAVDDRITMGITFVVGDMKFYGENNESITSVASGFATCLANSAPSDIVACFGDTWYYDEAMTQPFDPTTVADKDAYKTKVLYGTINLPENTSIYQNHYVAEGVVYPKEYKILSAELDLSPIVGNTTVDTSLEEKEFYLDDGEFLLINGQQIEGNKFTPTKHGVYVIETCDGRAVEDFSFEDLIGELFGA